MGSLTKVFPFYYIITITNGPIISFLQSCYTSTTMYYTFGRKVLITYCIQSNNNWLKFTLWFTLLLKTAVCIRFHFIFVLTFYHLLCYGYKLWSSVEEVFISFLGDLYFYVSWSNFLKFLTSVISKQLYVADFLTSFGL